MRTKTIISAGLLALSTAALAQVATTTDPKLGNGRDGMSSQPTNDAADAENAADNANDPGKP